MSSTWNCLPGVLEVHDVGLDRVLVVLLLRVEVADAGAVVHAGLALTVPVLTSILSTSVVLPAEPCPQKATLRMSSTFTFAMPDSFTTCTWNRVPMSASPAAAASAAASVSVPSYNARPMMQPATPSPRQPRDVVRRRHAAGGDHRHVDRRLHLGHRREVRPASMPSVAISV